MTKVSMSFDIKLLEVIRQRIINALNTTLTLNREYKLSQAVKDRPFFRIELMDAFGEKKKLVSQIKGSLPKKFTLLEKGGFIDINFVKVYEEMAMK